MTKDYDGHLVCLRCFKDNINQSLDDKYLDKIDNQLMQENVYKNIQREMFYENPKFLYMPQIDDVVYFNFQAYEEAVGYYSYHFITGEKERDGAIDCYFSTLLPMLAQGEKRPFHNAPIKCKIRSMSYHLPSATTFEMNTKHKIEEDEATILTELVLDVLDFPQPQFDNLTILYFNCEDIEANISQSYLIHESMYDQSVLIEQCHDLIGETIQPTIYHDFPKEILDVNDVEPEVYNGSGYRHLYYCQKVYNTNPDGYQFRSNVQGRTTMYQLGRLNTWDVKDNSSGISKSPNKILYRENLQFDYENQKGAFEELQKSKLIGVIEAFERNNPYAVPFIDDVTDDIAPDYLNVIAVEMNLSAIKENIQNDKYRSREMLMFDLKQIEHNCKQFNGEEAKFTKDAKKLNENLKKLCEQVLSHRLRNVPQRNIQTRGKDPSSTSEVSETKNTKRNPRKVSTRSKNKRRNGLDYNEESKDETRFKKPTPQKYQKIDDDDQSEQSGISNNFCIKLEGVSDSEVKRTTRRTTSSRLVAPEELKENRRQSKRNQKEAEEEDAYEPANGRNTRSSRRSKKKPNYRERDDDSDEFVPNDERDFIVDDDDDY